LTADFSASFSWLVAVREGSASQRPHIRDALPARFVAGGVAKDGARSIGRKRGQETLAPRGHSA
jgi:hypothetical protein